MFGEWIRKWYVAPRSWKTRHGVIFGGLAVLAACSVARYYWGISSAKAEVAADAPPAATDANAPPQPLASRPVPGAAAHNGGAPIPEVVAAINGQAISREELAVQCRGQYGKDVLETMVNKYLILAECRRLGVTVSRREVDVEIEQMARSFNLPVAQWLKMMQQERGIKPEQYANDIIWPTLALRKLAGEKLQVTQKELTDAFEAEYGAAVRARIIVCTDEKRARQAQALAAAKPDDFGNLAKEFSVDAPSASVKGMIQPVRKHSACPEIEQAAFALADGQVSDVIRTQGQFVVLKRDGLIAARDVKLEQVADRLNRIIRDQKMRAVSGDIFKDLQRRARVQNVFNDPRMQQQVGRDAVALVNGEPIYLRQLDDECLTRHGSEVLQSLIGRRMLELACRQTQVAVSEKEIDAEIARMASLMTRPLADGSPDVKSWLALVTGRQGISVEMYRRDIIWPQVALRKLAGGKVVVTEEDIKKGFESNYGPKVKCRAIVLNNLRRAQQVWEAARKTPTAENFGELASKYSIERSSRANEGLVSPIRRYGGQPELEKEAFALKPGELSGIINVGADTFIILFCEGYTTPVPVDFASVRKDIEDDIREKKQRVEMAHFYEHLQQTTTVDNFLEPELSHSPSKGETARQPAVPTVYDAPVRR
jgi:parvulin-like peptidyl-prolyl isomerase